MWWGPGDGGWAGWFFMALMMVVFWRIMIVLVVWLVRRTGLAREGMRDRPGRTPWQSRRSGSAAARSIGTSSSNARRSSRPLSPSERAAGCRALPADLEIGARGRGVAPPKRRAAAATVRVAVPLQQRLGA